MREDVFKNLNVLQKKNCEMSEEAARYLERLIRNGQRDGKYSFYNFCGLKISHIIVQTAL